MSTTTPTDSPDKSVDMARGAHPHPGGDQYYSELMRIISGLFVGLLALMTFLLTVGYSKPHQFFAWSLYASLVILPLNLIVFVFGQMSYKYSKSQMLAYKNSELKGDELAPLKKNWETSRKRLKAMRLVQQLLFVVAVIAVTCVAIAVAHFFFSIAATPSASTGQ